MKRILYLLLAVIISSCVQNTEKQKKEEALVDSISREPLVTYADSLQEPDTTMLDLKPEQVDSLQFRLRHHYAVNFNFVVKADSLTLIPREGDIIQDTCTVYEDDLLVVAEWRVISDDPIDSVWIKVANDQMVMGWIREKELLKNSTPDDTISEMLYSLTNSRLIWMSGIVALGIMALLLTRNRKLMLFDPNGMHSFYPSAFIITVAVMASLYASIQNFVPEFWQEYYFHPTMNPLVLPPLMASLVIMAWLVIIMFVAVIDVVYHNFYFLPGITYLLELSGLSMVVYLVIGWTTIFYAGYLLLPLLIIVLIYIHRKKLKSNKTLRNKSQ